MNFRNIAAFIFASIYEMRNLFLILQRFKEIECQRSLLLMMTRIF